MTDALALSPRDNVATVLRPIAAGETLTVRCGSQTSQVVAVDSVPFCHKISLSALAAGATVLKYGDPIGSATQSIAAGSHVHIHNMRSNRARQ